MLKGARLGVIDKKYAPLGKATFDGICEKYLKISDGGELNLGGICLVAGLDFGIVREGTVIFAVANGVLINLFLPHVEKLFTAVENLCGVSKSIT